MLAGPKLGPPDLVAAQLTWDDVELTAIVHSKMVRSSLQEILPGKPTELRSRSRPTLSLPKGAPRSPVTGFIVSERMLPVRAVTVTFCDGALPMVDSGRPSEMHQEFCVSVCPSLPAKLLPFAWLAT